MFYIKENVISGFMMQSVKKSHSYFNYSLLFSTSSFLPQIGMSGHLRQNLTYEGTS